jgi:WD40 repeat protein
MNFLSQIIFKKMKRLFLCLALIYFLQFVSCELSLKGTFKAHYFGITSLEISNDGDIVSAGGGDFDIKVWNSVTYELKNTIHCHNESEGLGFSIKNIVFLSNGDLASASSVYYYDKITYETRVFYKLWDLADSKMKTFQNGKSFQEVENMIKLKNDDLAIVTNDRILTLRDSQSLNVKTVLKPFKIDYVPFAGLVELENQDLLYGCGKTINIFDDRHLKTNFSLVANLNYIIMLKNGDLLTAESDESLRVWDKFNYQLKQTINDNKVTKGVGQMIQLENEDIVLATNDKSLNVIDGKTFELKQKIDVQDEVLAFNFLKNGDLVTGSSNGTISVWTQ